MDPNLAGTHDSSQEFLFAKAALPPSLGEDMRGVTVGDAGRFYSAVCQ